MDQQQRDGDGGDVMSAADLQDVSQAHDGRVSGRDVPWAHIVVHTQVEDDMDLWQVGVPRDVKLTLRKRRSRYSRVSVQYWGKKYAELVWSKNDTAE